MSISIDLEQGISINFQRLAVTAIFVLIWVLFENLLFLYFQTYCNGDIDSILVFIYNLYYQLILVLASIVGHTGYQNANHLKSAFLKEFIASNDMNVLKHCLSERLSCCELQCSPVVYLPNPNFVVNLAWKSG